MIDALLEGAWAHSATARAPELSLQTRHDHRATATSLPVTAMEARGEAG